MLIQQYFYTTCLSAVTGLYVIPVHFKHKWFPGNVEKSWFNLINIDIYSSLIQSNVNSEILGVFKYLNQPFYSRNTLRLHSAKTTNLTNHIYMASKSEASKVDHIYGLTTLKYLPVGLFEYPVFDFNKRETKSILIRVPSVFGLNITFLSFKSYCTSLWFKYNVKIQMFTNEQQAFSGNGVLSTLWMYTSKFPDFHILCGMLPSFSIYTEKNLAHIHITNHRANFHLQYQVIKLNLVRTIHEIIPFNHNGSKWLNTFMHMQTNPSFLKSLTPIYIMEMLTIFHWLARVTEIYVVQFEIFTKILRGTQCTVYVYDSPDAVSMPLAEVTEKYSDFNVTCSTFQCYLLLKCSKWDKISLVKVAKSHPKYEDHHFKIIPLNNLPLSVHFSNDGMSSGQQVGKYGVKMKDDTYLDNIYLSIQLMSNYSLGSYNGINCTYGGILVLEELESQQYVIRHRLCGSQTGAFRDELALTMTGQTVILVFYYYKGFGKIMADIQIKFSQCVGIFLDPMKGVQCRYPVHCDLIYDKCLFKDVLNISYPKETCFHIQYIDNHLLYMNKRMFQMTVSGFFNNVHAFSRSD